MADVYRRAAGAEIGVMNTGGVRDEIETGPVSLRDLFEAAPFGNTIVSVDLTGRQLAALFEASLGAGGVTSLEVAGVEVIYDPDQPPGARVVRVTLSDGRPVEEFTRYRVAANNFIADGGDGYSVLLEGANRRETGIVDLDAFRRSFAAGPVEPPRGRPYRTVAEAAGRR